ncbi:MAG: hypothetical protein DCF29_14770 [Alphaproteobacteria bacterium]|nr:MAG: hypothetical protein DCF29_14770 [Alphaproteobacteria bacterium]
MKHPPTTVSNHTRVRCMEHQMLTPKEMLCLSGVARHLQADEIAIELGVSQKTVETHLSNIRKKLGVTSSRLAVRHVFGESLQTEPLEGFSSILDASDHLQSAPPIEETEDAENRQTDSGVVHRGLVARDSAQRNERHAVGGSGRRYRSLDPQYGQGVGAQALDQDAVVGRSATVPDAASSAAPADFGRGYGPGAPVNDDGRERRGAGQGDGGAAKVELHGFGSGPVIHLVGAVFADRDRQAPRLFSLSGRSFDGNGDGETADTAGVRSSLFGGPEDGGERTTIDGLKSGSPTPELLFRLLLLMGAVLGLTILALCLLTLQDFSLWLRHLLFR